MYYFSVKQGTKKSLDFVEENPKILTDEDLLKVLKKEGYCYLSDINLLILLDPQFINQIFPNAKFDEYAFRYLIEIQTECYCVTNYVENGKKNIDKQDSLSFRVLIDPT